MSVDGSGWEVSVQGRDSDLRYLARHFTAPPVVVVKQDDQDGYVLRLDEFSGCNDDGEVLAAADRQIVRLSGIIKIRRGTGDSIRAGHVLRRHPGGRKDVFVRLEGAVVRCEVGVVGVGVSDSEGRPVPQPVVASREERLFALCCGDPAVDKLARLMAAADSESWVGLYRRYELIEADSGGQRALEARDWCASADFGRFRHSANSVTVAGDGARHGKETTAPPSKPMTLEEANAFVCDLMEKWLASKGV